MNKKSSFLNKFLFLSFGLAILLLGAIITLAVIQNTKKNITTNLLNFSKSITAAINPDRVKTLTASLLDDDNPDYIRLNQQLEKVQPYMSTQGIRWSYLVLKKNNQLLFSADSIPVGHFGDALSGETYNDPPSELSKIFQDQQAIISQPYKDQWGYYISAFIPIKDFSTGEILAVAGFDIDYEYLQTQIYYQTIIPLISTFTALFIYVVIFFLVSRRFKQDIEIKESEERFYSIIEFSIDPIVMMNEEGNITLWNKAAEKTFGYSEDEAIGKSLYQLVLPPKKYDTTLNLSSLKKFAQTGISQFAGKITELETINKTGKIIPIEFSTTLINIKDKNYVFGIIRDVSIRKANEAALIKKTKELENSRLALSNSLEDVEEAAADLEKFKLAVEDASDHIIITDPNGIILYANKAVKTITGFSTTEVIGKKAGNKELWGGLMDQSFYEDLWKTIKINKKVFIGEMNNKRKNGQKYIVLASISPVLNKKKELVFFVGIERDITHEKEVDRMKTEFISLASHQLRTPLSAIKWYAEMLLTGDAGKLKPEQLKFVDDINLSNQRMIELVNTLLNISRIESGRIIIEPKPTDLKEIINSVVSEFKPKLKEKDQKIIVNINPNLPKINCDPKLIFEVYKNLISNAIKYSRQKGEIEIFISSDKDSVVNQITDEGYGIPKKDESKVFSKFYRGENILKVETEGTGLGLYLTKSIIESSGGKIWFKSEENKGTTFWFNLPLKGVKFKKGEVSINS